MRVDHGVRVGLTTQQCRVQLLTLLVIQSSLLQFVYVTTHYTRTQQQLTRSPHFPLPSPPRPSSMCNKVLPPHLNRCQLSVAEALPQSGLMSVPGAAGGRLAVVWLAVSGWVALVFVVLVVMHVVLRSVEGLWCRVSRVVLCCGVRSTGFRCGWGLLWLA